MTRRVVICGNGVAAAALVVALAKHKIDLHVTVIGRGAFWRGLAYATSGIHHLLNVPAKSMALDHEVPDHFLNWLKPRGSVDADGFVPRGLYGTYLEDTIRQSLKEAPWLRLEQISAELLGLTRQPDRWQVFHGQGVLAADALVLATGVERPSPLADRYGKEVVPYLVEDPWQPWDVRPLSRILILGAGLTAVDTALNLIHARHKGPIVMLSRHGVMPLPHNVRPTVPKQINLPTAPLSQRLHSLREAAKEAGHWPDVFDGLRPQWQSLWERLPEDERLRFLRHGAAYFNIHRHRMAPEVAATLAAAQKRNLDVRRGRVLAMAPGRDGLRVTLRLNGREKTVWFDKVLNCTGPNTNTGLSGQTFIQTLVGAGLALPDPLGLGIEVDQKNRVRGREGWQHSLFAMGALCRGQWWEITALPEIRQQAVQIARSLAEICAPRAESTPRIISSPFFAREDHEHCISSVGP